MNQTMRRQLAESRRALAQCEETLRGATRHTRAIGGLLNDTPEPGAQRDYLLNELSRAESFCDELDTTIDDHRSRIARLEQQERLDGRFSK